VLPVFCANRENAEKISVAEPWLRGRKSGTLDLALPIAAVMDEPRGRRLPRLLGGVGPSPCWTLTAKEEVRWRRSMGADREARVVGYILG